MKIDRDNFLDNLSEKEKDLYRVHYLEAHSEEEEREILGLKKTMVRKELTKLNKVIKEFINYHKNK
jgi:DNA-directed RNA polymerase specialized sigma24 family protein